MLFPKWKTGNIYVSYRKLSNVHWWVWIRKKTTLSENGKCVIYHTYKITGVTKNKKKVNIFVSIYRENSVENEL